MTLTLLIDFWKTGNDRHDCREGYPTKAFLQGEGQKRVKNKKFFSALPKTGPKQTNERVTQT